MEAEARRALLAEDFHSTTQPPRKQQYAFSSRKEGVVVSLSLLTQ